MTRTERNHYPAALLKDRHSRSGQPNSESGKKHGAGAHNWGSFQQESEFQLEGDLDAQRDLDDFVNDETDSDEVKDDIADIKSPASSESSIDSVSVPGQIPVGLPRRLSNVSDEEREKARVYREGVIKRGGYDLANIARTSFGADQSSPTKADYLGTSPTATKTVGRQ